MNYDHEYYNDASVYKHAENITSMRQLGNRLNITVMMETLCSVSQVGFSLDLTSSATTIPVE